MRTLLKMCGMLLSICLAVGTAFAETISLPSFSSFVWEFVPSAQVQGNASYTVYAQEVSPEIGKSAVLEYINALVTGASAQELARAEDEATGDLIVAYAVPSCEEMGFRTSVDEQTVRGCHILLIWKSGQENDGSGALYLYLNRGLQLSDTGNRTAILPSPTPSPSPTTAPTPRLIPQPASDQDNDSNSWDVPVPTGSSSGFCSECGGSGWRDCLTCDGNGYVEYSGYVPSYGAGGGGSYHETKPCPNVLCQNGKVKCFACGGTGQR